MMKTPDEIKKGLECCKDVPVGGPCPGKCPLLDLCKSGDDGAAQREILALIQQLTEEGEAAIRRANILMEHVQQLEAERDAAVADLENLTGCMSCMLLKAQFEDMPCGKCSHCVNVTSDGSKWQWRGVQKEE